MKKILILFFITCFFGLAAQPPQAFKYQAVVRDASGDIIQNQAVGIRISIRNIWTGGTILYQETFTETTNNFGQVNLEIGNGATTFGIFTNIQWGIDKKFIEIEIDTGGGYVSMGTSEFLSVPYALHAGSTNDTSVWKYNGNRLYYNGGRVGIGITNPSNMLHVEATGNEYGIYGGSTGGFGVTGKTSADAHAGVIGIGNSATSFGLQGLNNFGGTALIAQSSGGLAGHFVGDVKIDEDSPYLYFNNGSSELAFMGFWSPTSDMNIFNKTASGSLKFGTNSIEHIRIDPYGNVGIGTTTPGNFKLNVNGRIITKGISVGDAYFGVYISDAEYGISISDATYDGFTITNAGNDGFNVTYAGNPSTMWSSAYNNGLEVAGAEGNGVYVGRADQTGVYVNSTGDDGVVVIGAHHIGLYGKTTSAIDEWGVYTPDKLSALNVTSKGNSTYAKNIGNSILEPGDIVCIAGGTEENVLDGWGYPVINISKADNTNSQAVFGVVEYKVAIREKEMEAPEGEIPEIRKSFGYADGNISPGDYLSVIYLGQAEVKVNEAVNAGDVLVAGNGGARKVITTEVNGITIAENTGILGKALEDSNGKDKIKVFVNCK